MDTPQYGSLSFIARLASQETDGAAEEMDEQGRWYGFEEDVDDVPIDSELPILPLRGTTVFPASIAPLLISRESSLSLVEEALASDRVIGMVAQRAAELEIPGPEDLHT